MKGSMLAAAVLPALILVLLIPYRSARADVAVSGGVSVSAGVAVSSEPATVVVAPAPPPAVVVVA